MTSQHPAVLAVLDDTTDPRIGREVDDWMTTSQTLARALAVGCLSRLNKKLTSVSIWDPAAGSGYAGSMLVHALESVGIQVSYLGQDIYERAVAASRQRFAAVGDAEIAHADTLARDPFAGFAADLIIVDAPWGMDWRRSANAVQSRRDAGEFRFGLPQQNDSTWLFISLALEKLRPTAEGGGRVAALVNPSALSSGGASAAVRQAIVESGLLESVTCLPEGLAPNTSIPLYLLTFTNRPDGAGLNRAMIADMRAQFSIEDGRRSMPTSVLQELEFGLRSGKSGPRNRTIGIHQFTRRDAKLVKTCNDGYELFWRLTTFNNTEIDPQIVQSRYGPDSAILFHGIPRETIDLNPSHIFGDESRELVKDLHSKSWLPTRLSRLLAREPEALKNTMDEAPEDHLFIPTTQAGRVSTESSKTESDGRVLSVRLDSQAIHAGFLAAWLNSEQGFSSRRRAIEASSSGVHLRALRSDPNSLIRWADELIVPMPPRDIQLSIASADERLRSFQAELGAYRASIWASPDGAEGIVGRIAGAFEKSASAWLDQLPYPLATALWAAETAASPGEKQLAYIHAWEAIVAFHATVLLSAIRNTPGSGSEVQTAIRRAFEEHRLGIERATLGTWIVIAEKTSREVRRALETNDADEVARVRKAFGDLSRAGIERLISKDVVRKFNEVNGKRNRWLGHAGYISDDEKEAQVDSLVSDLSDLRQLIGDVWAQLVLVRAGSLNRGRDGYVQSAEVALGAKSPFRKESFAIGDPMVRGDLYLVRDGSQSPVRLLQFVQLRSAPRDAHYTSYFYNRTEGANFCLVSYQHGPESELQESAERFRDDFGALMLD